MAFKKLTLLIVIATVLFSCETESFKDDVLVEVENPTVDNTTENDGKPVTERETEVIDVYNEPNNGL